MELAAGCRLLLHALREIFLLVQSTGRFFAYSGCIGVGRLLRRRDVGGRRRVSSLKINQEIWIMDLSKENETEAISHVEENASGMSRRSFFKRATIVGAT